MDFKDANKTLDTFGGNWEEMLSAMEEMAKDVLNKKEEQENKEDENKKMEK